MAMSKATWGSEMSVPILPAAAERRPPAAPTSVAGGFEAHDPPAQSWEFAGGIPVFACTRSVSRGRSWKLCSDHSGRSFAVLHRRDRGRGVRAAEEAKAARWHAGGPRALLRGNAGCSSVTGRATCQRVVLRCIHRVVLRFYVQKLVELTEQGVNVGASACAIASACGCGCGCG
jgi:hypothetical protein